MLQRLTTKIKSLSFSESLLRRNPIWYRHAIRHFDRLDVASLELRERWDADRLSVMLRIAARTPYGSRIAKPEDLNSWPLLDSETVRATPNHFMRMRQLAVPASTGGTSGIPLRLRRSFQSVAVEQAAHDHLLRSHGVNVREARVAVLRGDDIKDSADRTAPFWIDVHNGRRRIFSSNHIGSDTVGAYVTALRDFNADYWWVYPAALGSLLRAAAEAGEPLNVPLILSSSEVLSDELRLAAESQLNCSVVDYYGQAERVAFAWCDTQAEWRFLPGYAHVELIPRGCDEASSLFEIVGTAFWNKAMVLVRYRTGDLIRLPSDASGRALEEIALGIRSFPAILGRDGDVLVAPDGTVLTGIDHFHRGVGGVMRIQVAQLTIDHVVIRVIPAPGFGETQIAQLHANARRKLPPSIRIEVQIVDALERTEIGKTPFIVRGRGVPGVRSPSRL